MAARKTSLLRPLAAPAFASLGITYRTEKFRRSAVVFAQGDPATEVMYLLAGAVTLSVLSPAGKEAIVSVLQPGDFFGEGCLAGQPLRMATATAIAVSSVAIIDKAHMIDMMHREPAFNDRFLAHMLARNIRIEEDLVDHLFNSAEKRLARTLLLLARYGSRDGSPRVVPKLSQEALAEIVGTTRGRVNFFMNKFRKLGFVDYDGGMIHVHPALLSVVLHD